MTAHKVAWFSHDMPVTYCHNEDVIIKRLLNIMASKPLNEIRTRAKHFKIYDEMTPNEVITEQDPQPLGHLEFPQHIITLQLFPKHLGYKKLNKPLTISYPYGPQETPFIEQP